MTETYRPRKPIKQIIKNFKGFKSLEDFAAANFSEELPLNAGTLPQPRPKRDNAIYLNDKGKGRISDGVRSLVGVTLTLSGVSSNSINLFNSVIYYNPFNLRALNDVEGRKFVYENLGLVEFIEFTTLSNKRVVSSMNELADRIFKAVKNQTFTYDAFIDETLRKSKMVVKSSMNQGDIYE